MSPITTANVDNNASKEVKLIVTIFSAFAIAPAEQELSDTIVTGSRVGFVLSNVTCDPSVVSFVPISGFPWKSINEISNAIKPSGSPSAIAYTALYWLLPRPKVVAL